MNSKNSLLKLGMATLAFCLLLTAFLTGCGGSNSSGGTSASSTVTGADGSTTTLPSAYTVRGKLVSDGSSALPVGNITVKLMVQNATTGALSETGRQYVTLTSGEFSFESLTRATYVLKAEGNTSYFDSSKLLIINETNTESAIDFGNMIMVTRSSFVPGNYTLIGTAVSKSGSATPISNLTVSLWVQTTNGLQDTGKTSVTLTSGQYLFSGLATGTYVLKIAETNKYLAASQIALVNESNTPVVDSGEIALVEQPTPDPTIATLDFRGRLVDAVTSVPLSVAIITLESGQSTVTDGFGIFELKNLSTGTGRMTVYQPGMASFTVSYEVKGSTPPTATSLLINGTTYVINSGARTVDLVGTYDIPITLSLHKSGTLLGTVKKFTDNGYGFPTSTLEPYPGYEFELWQVYPDKSSRRFGSVKSNADGTWRVDNLPPNEDNGALWFAVPINTTVSIQQGNTGNVAVFSNSSSQWLNRDPVLAYGYMVKAGETTVMDFTVPSFVYFPNKTGSVNPIADAKFSFDNVNYLADIATATITSDMYFRWTGPGTSTVITLEFTRAYKGAEVSTVTKSYIATDTSPTKIHAYPEIPKIKPITIGLDYGRFTWRTLANDPLQPDFPQPSDSHIFNVIPGSDELSPASGSTIQRSVATYTVTFVAPTDSEATQAKMEIEQWDAITSKWVQQGTSNAMNLTSTAVFSLTYPEGGNPAAGTYRWRVGYFYPDGPPMFSDYAILIFQ